MNSDQIQILIKFLFDKIQSNLNTNLGPLPELNLKITENLAHPRNFSSNETEKSDAGRGMHRAIACRKEHMHVAFTDHHTPNVVIVGGGGRKDVRREPGGCRN